MLTTDWVKSLNRRDIACIYSNETQLVLWWPTGKPNENLDIILEQWKRLYCKQQSKRL